MEYVNPKAPKNVRMTLNDITEPHPKENRGNKTKRYGNRNNDRAEVGEVYVLVQMVMVVNLVLGAQNRHPYLLRQQHTYAQNIKLTPT